MTSRVGFWGTGLLFLEDAPEGRLHLGLEDHPVPCAFSGGHDRIREGLLMRGHLLPGRLAGHPAHPCEHFLPQLEVLLQLVLEFLERVEVHVARLGGTRDRVGVFDLTPETTISPTL
jgi:hypothetical protein